MSRLQPPALNYLRPVSRQSHYDSEKSLRQPGTRLQSPLQRLLRCTPGGAFAPRGPANTINSKPIAPNPKIPAEIAARTARLCRACDRRQWICRETPGTRPSPRPYRPQPDQRDPSAGQRTPVRASPPAASPEVSKFPRRSGSRWRWLSAARHRRPAVRSFGPAAV